MSDDQDSHTVITPVKELPKRNNDGANHQSNSTMFKHSKTNFGGNYAKSSGSQISPPKHYNPNSGTSLNYTPGKLSRPKDSSIGRSNAKLTTATNGGVTSYAAQNSAQKRRKQNIAPVILGGSSHTTNTNVVVQNLYSRHQQSHNGEINK